MQELRRQVASEWGDPDAVLIADETGFPKKGVKSVGVKRQYSGTLGRTDNCQVGVFLTYSATRGHTLVDRRLFLPAEWAADRPRRAGAGVSGVRGVAVEGGEVGAKTKGTGAVPLSQPGRLRYDATKRREVRITRDERMVKSTL